MNREKGAKHMKIVLLEAKTVSAGDVSLKAFYALGEVTEYQLTPQCEVIERTKDAEAVIINKTVFTRDIIESLPKLKYIGLCATGYNNVDTVAAAEHGITVCNVPNYSTGAVAQQVFSYILHFACRTADYNEDVHKGGWIASETFSYFTIPTFELAGMTLGIIGFGSIGRAVADIGKAFGMKIIVSTRTPKAYEGAEFVTENELFSRSDFITLHCPLTEQTNGMVNLEKLRLCKPSAILINTSRGPVVNENDLAAALNIGIIAGAAVDVISCEPMLADNPLMDAKNCIITPHVSWAPVQTRQRAVDIAAENLRCFIVGAPQNMVN